MSFQTLESGIAEQRRRARGRERSAFTMVELLVVMAILAIGMVALITMFIAALPASMAGENSTMAQNLAASKLDGAQPDNQALGVVGQDLTLPVLNFLNPNFTPDAYASTPFGPAPSFDDPRFSGLNRQRRILGRQLRVPPPSVPGPNSPWASAIGPVSIHMLEEAPLYDVIPNAGSLGLAVTSGTSLKRVVIPKPPLLADYPDLATWQTALNVMGLQQEIDVNSYGINYDLGILYLAEGPTDRLFTVDYRFIEVTPPTAQFGRALRNHCVIVPGTATPGLKAYRLRDDEPMDLMPICPPFAALPAAGELERGTDRIFRRFDVLALGTPFSNTDPYQVKILDARMGILGFNPLGAAITPPRHNDRGLVAKVDYDVDDWHILRDVAQAPRGAGQIEIKLRFPRIKRLAEVEENLNLDAGLVPTLEYQGLVRNYPGRLGTLGIDLIILDLETGLRIDSRTLQGDLSSPGVNGEIDYQRGVIRFTQIDPGNPSQTLVSWIAPGASGANGADYLPPTSIQGQHLAVFYRSSDDWGVMLEKPFSHYVHGDLVNNTFLQVGEYWVTGRSFLLFPLADVGKNVMVDYRWEQQLRDSGGNAIGTRIREERGEMHRIKSATEPGNLTGFNLGWIQLKHLSPQPGDPAANPEFAPGTLRVQGVRGASLNARVAWREGSRWRQFQRETVLPRVENP